MSIRTELASCCLFLVAGCASDAPAQFREWPAGLDVAFVVELDGQTLVRHEGPYFAGTPFSIGIPSDHTALLVGWSEEALRAADPDLRDLSGIQIEPSSETCAETGRLLIDARRRSWPFPDSTQVFELSGEGQPASERPLDFASWSISLPVDLERCAGELRPLLLPFAGDGRMLPPGSAIPNDPSGALRTLMWAATVDADRIVAAAAQAIYLFDRGQPWEGSPQRRILSAELEEKLRFESLWIRSSTVPGHFELIFAMNQLPGGPESPRLGRVAITPEGFGVPEIVFRGPDEVRQLLSDRDQLVVLFEHSIYKASGGSELELAPLFELPEYSLKHMLVRDRSPRYVIAGRAGWLGWGDLDQSPQVFDSTFIGEIANDIRLDIELVAELGERILLSTSQLGLYVTEDFEVFTPTPIEVPWAGDCGTTVDACGVRDLDYLPRLLSDRNQILVVSETCNYVALGPSEDCLLPVELSDSVRTEPPIRVVSAEHTGGRFLILGENGLLLELD